MSNNTAQNGTIVVLGTVHGSTTISYTAEGQTFELVAVVQNQTHLDIAGDAFEFSAV